MARRIRLSPTLFDSVIRMRFLPRVALVAFALSVPVAGVAQTPWESELVFEDSDGTLAYRTDAEGNRLPDFSRAGYGGGGVPLPEVPALLTLSPEPGDDTARIQTALNAVGAQRQDENGFRGAVVLSAGEYEISGTLQVRRSGVVLRGVGAGEDPATNTILRRRGTNQAPVVVLGASTLVSSSAFIRQDASGPTSQVIDAVVPIGTTTITVEDPEGFAAGDDVVVFHPATEDWLAAIDGGGTAGDPPWGVGEIPIALVRTIKRVDGATLTLDAPTFTRFEARLSPSFVYTRDRSGIIEQVGLEDLRIDIETASPTSEDHAEDAVRFLSVENGWASGVTALHFWHAGISVQNSRYVTVTGCEALEPHSLVTGSRRYNFEVQRSQLVLFEGNRATDARHAYVGNGESLDSGIAFVDNVSENASTSSESHRRWGTGFLWDNHVELGTTGSGSSARRLHLGNRGDFGTAHGWACAHCVAWNAQMNGSELVVEKPPTAQNYAIGTQGRAVDDGPFLSNTGSYIEGADRPGLTPRSLYHRQVEDRLRGTSEGARPEGDAGVRIAQVAPNPARETLRIRFDLPDSGPVRLQLVDMLGRTVATLADGPRAEGENTVSLDVRPLARGVYVLRLEASGAIVSRTVSIVR